MTSLAFLGEGLRNVGANARFVVLSCPYEKTASYLKGTALAPREILAASEQLEHYDEKLRFSPVRAGIRTAEIWYPNLPSDDPESVIEAYRGFFRRKFDPLSQVPVLIGGEHSVSLALVPLVAEAYHDLGVVLFDAHADLRDSYQGSRFSHACVSRRLLDTFPIAQFGIRSLSEEEARLIEQRSLSVAYAHTLKGAEGFIRALDEALSKLPQNVYLSIDVDCLDASAMPDVGTPEPFGLSMFELEAMVEVLTKRKRVVGFDLVEHAPLSPTKASTFSLARFLYRTIGLIAISMGWASPLETSLVVGNKEGSVHGFDS